jgi:hypothetical protein
MEQGVHKGGGQGYAPVYEPSTEGEAQENHGMCLFFILFPFYFYSFV